MPSVTGSTGPKGTILLVEDEASVRAFTSRALRLNGYDVIEASQADEALDIVRQSNHHIDIFITDIVMPGQSGPEWVRDALILRPEAKVIFVSGYTPDKLDVDIRGISEEEPVFLAKPFALSDIVKAVEGQMSRAVSHA